MFDYMALRDIKAGEEMTVFYTRPDAMAETRRNTLKTTYGFVCECWRCKFEIDQQDLADVEKKAELQVREEAFINATICPDEDCLGVRLPHVVDGVCVSSKCACCGLEQPYGDDGEAQPCQPCQPCR